MARMMAKHPRADRAPFPGSYRAQLVDIGLKRARKAQRVDCPHCGLSVADLKKHLAVVHEEAAE